MKVTLRFDVRCLASNSAIKQTRRERIKNPLLQGRETTVSWIARNFDALAGAGASFFTSLFIELTEGFLVLSGYLNKE